MIVETKIEPKLATLRNQLPAVNATGYFNAGSNGPLPVAAHEALVATAMPELQNGRIVPGNYDRNRKRNRQVAGLVAEMFGADADEIALTHSTSEGLATVLMGMTWQRGDEIVTTPLEHPGLLLPLGVLAHRLGVILRWAEVGMGGGDAVGAIARALTSRTRLIAISHLMWSTGAVMELREIAALAREREVLVLIDGAQAAGQIPVNVHELGVDAYALPGQKWLCGPEATGALYVRRARWADVAPSFLRYGQFEPTGYVLPVAGAQRYEIGEFYSPAVDAFAASLRWLCDDVSLDWAYSRTAELGRRCWDGLHQIAGVTMLTPRDRMAGLVNFSVVGLSPQSITDTLHRQYKLTIRYVDYRPCPPSARVACAWWNTEEEIDRLVSAVGEIVATVVDQTSVPVGAR